MIIWNFPWAFLLLLPLLGLWIWKRWHKNEERPVFQYSTVRPAKMIKKGFKVYLIPLVGFSKYLALVFAIVALARPQKADEVIKKNIDGVDIVIAFDISDSMIIEDMPPLNRLECAKENMRQFVEGRSNDRIGLVVFMGESYTKVPLTMDYKMLIDVIKELEPSRSMKMGTAIGVGLANAVGRLKDSKAKSKVIIFMTDGENNSGLIDPETALAIAKSYGIKIYSIGIGKDGETKLPIISVDPFGNKIKRYQPFYSSVNEELLKLMATETGGQFWRATSARSMEQVFKEIDKLEKTKIEINKYTNYTELFPVWLSWAFFFLFFSLILERVILRRFP
jgi:Ca-activated chloride channel family protein